MASTNAKKLIKNLLEGTKAVTGYYGFGDLYANTDGLVSSIYGGIEYSDQDRTDLIAWFAASKVKVFGEYPRTNAQLPAVFLFRMSDSEAGKGEGVLGDGGDYDDDLETDFEDVAINATLFKEQIAIHLWADSSGPSQRDDLYLALREIIIRGRRYLHDGGLHIVEWGQGKDGQLYLPEREPHIVHTAQATLNYAQFMTSTTTTSRIMDIETRAVENGEVTVGDWEDEWG